MRNFIVSGLVQDDAAGRVWPWLRLLPGPWRRSAARWAGSAPVRVAATADGEIVGHALPLAAAWPPGKTARVLATASQALSPLAYGWAADVPPPGLPGMAWRSGRLLALLSILGLFHPLDGVFGNPAALSLLLIGGRQPEFSVAARLLARLVGRLVLVCPAENFRNRLAVQILTESGLAVTTLATPPAGWEIAVDLRPLPPLVTIGGSSHQARTLFPRPLRHAAVRPFLYGSEHPVWAECQLACMSPPGAPPFPDGLSVESVLAAQCYARRAGVGFALA